MKHFLVIGATALLCACGGQNVHESAPLGALVTPGTAPWLTVADGADKLEVRGLDHKLTLEPAPGVSAAVQTQLGLQLQSSYVPDLVVTCGAPAASVRVDQDKSPGNVAMELALHCAIWAHGFDADHDYKTQVSVALAGDADDQAYAQALAKLLTDSAGDIAHQMRGDIHTLARR